MAGVDGVKVHLQRQMMKPGCHQVSPRCDWLIGIGLTCFRNGKRHDDVFQSVRCYGQIDKLATFRLRAALNKAPLKVNGNTANAGACRDVHCAAQANTKGECRWRNVNSPPEF